MRPGLLAFLAIFQAILFAAHLFVYETWLHLWSPPAAANLIALRAVTVVLAVSFLAASLFTFKFWNLFTRIFYRASAVWLGVFNFLFLASIFSWLTVFSAGAIGLHPGPRTVVATWFVIGLAFAVWGLVNASLTRVSRIKVKLQNLPSSWRGRTAAMISDLHLGHVRGANFARNIVARVRQLRPEIVFLTGDLYDGSYADLDALASPLRALNPPLGGYFVAGNHEEILNLKGHLEAVRKTGLRLLNNEKIVVDGMQIIGVHHRDAAHPDRLNEVLSHAAIDREQASVLLVHAPDQLAVAERAGISLQLSGHTHRGQFFPWTWVTRKIYKEFVYGLQRFGKMLVYTSSGAGTWGPPLRVCSAPEIVLIQFE
jgi:predicted MPP superfamily phosphohydrolase